MQVRCRRRTTGTAYDYVPAGDHIALIPRGGNSAREIGMIGFQRRDRYDADSLNGASTVPLGPGLVPRHCADPISKPATAYRFVRRR